MASTLKEFRVALGLSIDGVIELIYGTTDPSTGGGRAANIGSIYLRNDSIYKQVWQKFDTSNTSWRLVDVGAALTPIVRTNNPTIAANQANANISALDSAIGADSALTPLTRTVGQLSTANSLYANLDLLDTVIGSDAQLTGGNYVAVANSIMQNLKSLDVQVSSLVSGVAWYSPSPFVITDDADLRAAANGTTLSTLLPFSDDEGTQLVIGDFTVDDILVSRDNGGTHKLFKVYDDTGTLKITTVGVTQLVTGNTFFARHSLVVAGQYQENVSAFRYNGTDILLFMQFDVEDATTIGLTGTYSPTNGTIVNTDSVQQAVQKLDANAADVQTLTGTSQGAVDLGTFTGATINDNDTIKSALQDLETAHEKERLTFTKANTTSWIIDSVSVDAVDVVRWIVHIRQTANPTRVEKCVITAMHDGIPGGADAVNVDYDRSSILRLDTAIVGLTFTVDLNGTTTSQVMRLTIAATAAVDIKCIRQIL